MTDQITEQTNPYTFEESFENFQLLFFEVEEHLRWDSVNYVDGDQPTVIPNEMFVRCLEIQNEFVDLFEKLVNLEGDIKGIVYEPFMHKFTVVEKVGVDQ